MRSGLPYVFTGQLTLRGPRARLGLAYCADGPSKRACLRARPDVRRSSGISGSLDKSVRSESTEHSRLLNRLERELAVDALTGAGMLEEDV
jgi:hypothetical protein